MKSLILFFASALLVLLAQLVEAQMVRIGCETDSVSLEYPSGKEISAPIQIKSGTNVLVCARRNGYRTLNEVVKGSSTLAKKGHTMAALTRIPERSELGHFFDIGEMNLSFKKGSVSFVRYESPEKELKMPDKPLISKKNEDEMSSGAAGSADILTEVLDRFKLRAPENEFFKDNLTSLKLAGTIDGVRLVEYTNGSYARMELIINWKILDVFDQIIEEVRYKTNSNPMLGSMGYVFYMDNSTSDILDYISRAILEDVLEQSVLDVLVDEDIRQALADRAERLAMIGSQETIRIKKPTASLPALGDQLAAIVTIEREDGHGSGCIISPDGYIITNYHVSGDGSDTLTVVLSNGTKHFARVERTDPVYDLALIKIEASGLSAIRPEKNYTAKLGERVHAIGTPADPLLGQTVTRGIVSAFRTANGFNLIQTDAVVNPGNSGGALVSADGKLIGVVSSKAMGIAVEGVGFAIPSEYVYNRLNIDFN